jgi:hypothetical protein
LQRTSTNSSAPSPSLRAVMDRAKRDDGSNRCGSGADRPEAAVP